MIKKVMSWLGAKVERRSTVLLALLGSLVMIATQEFVVCILFFFLWIVNLYAPDSWFGIENEQQPKKD